MSKLITFGCSHTQGYYYKELQGLIPSYNAYYKYHGNMLPPIWPEILADKLQLDLLNLGKGGAGNDSIFRIFGLNIDKIEKGDTVIYQIGQNVRIPHAVGESMLDLLVGTSKDKWRYEDVTFEQTQGFFINRDRDPWTKSVLLSYIKIVDEVVRNKGANLWFWGDDSRIVSMIPAVRELWNIIGRERWIKKPGEPLLSYLIDHYDNATIEQETNGAIYDVHMGKYGHELQANYMYNFIDEFTHLQPNSHENLI
jgi:hypothetical protein